MIQRAERRIFLSSLYIGTEEKELVRVFSQRYGNLLTGL